MHIANENELLAAVSTTLPRVEQALVFAPHPDDEVFGCGGTLSLLRDAGVRIKVHILTDGCHGGENSNGLLPAIRAKESCAALQVLGLSEPEYWGLPDRGLCYGELLILQILNVIKTAAADLIFLPSAVELHPDHQVLAFAGIEALKRLGGERKVAFYELSSPLSNPNLFIDISAVAQQKREAMACYHTQLKEQPYVERISGLNAFRSYSLGPTATSAEAFVLLDITALHEVKSLLLDGTSVYRKKLGFAVSGDDLPLVSIIVRSMDRSTLKEALDSLALQTYPNVEIILVDAIGGGHSFCGDRCGRFLLRIVGDRDLALSRPRAANIGLKACNGCYIGFLDDDDTVEPRHIALLVEALQTLDEPSVVYAGARGLQRSGSRDAEITLFAEPEASFSKLLLGNVIPIHTVLFPSSLLTSGICFDESLDVYEDWDFWLQLSKEYPFVFINEITSTYYTDGDSGVAPVSQLEDKAWERESHLLNKWLKILTPEQLKSIARLYHVTFGNLNEMRHQLNLLQAHSDRQLTLLQAHSAEKRQLAASRKEVQDKDQQLRCAEQELQNVLTSTTWKLAAPIRFVAKLVFRCKILWRFFSFLIARPGKLHPSLRRLYKGWQIKGFLAVKHLVNDIPLEVDRRDQWLNYQKQLNTHGCKEIQELILQMKDKPMISILMPTYNTTPAILRETLDSVLNQLYPVWQLCVVDDASSDPKVRKILEQYARQDSRIKLSFQEINAGIAKTTNRALKMAEGEYVALLDHDDILEKQALFRVAESILTDNPDLIYSDEVMVFKDGNDVHDFVFRPAFSLELLRSHPYIVHLAVIRTDLLRKLGGLDESLPISQDYDLFLRVVEQAETIVHIPEILYRWRQQNRSAGHDKKDMVMETSTKVLENHLERCGEIAKVGQGKIFNFFEVRYPVQAQVKVAIIIPTKNHGRLVRQCIESIERTVLDIQYQILVVDHESSDQETLSYFDQLRVNHQVLRYEGTFNFSAINNWAVAQLPDNVTHYLFLNNDIEALEEGWLERMMELGQKEDVGIVGATLFYPGNEIYQHAGVCVGMYGMAEHYGKWLSRWVPDGSLQPGYLGSLIANHEVSAVTAACLLMRRDVFEEVNGFDEALAVGFGDVDLCLRTRQVDYRVLYCPHAALIHHESYTRGQSHGEDPHPQDSAFFRHRWQPFLCDGDPYYNPSLSLRSTCWDVAEPLVFRPQLQRRVFRKSS